MTFSDEKMQIVVASYINEADRSELVAAGFPFAKDLSTLPKDKPNLTHLYPLVRSFHVLDVSTACCDEERKELHDLVHQFRENLKKQQPKLYAFILAVTEKRWARLSKVKTQTDFETLRKQFEQNLALLEKEINDVQKQ